MRLVTPSQHPDVVRLVGVTDWITIDETELLPQQLNVLRIAGQELPAWSNFVRLGVSGQLLRRVLIWLERDRVHEDVFADPLAKQFLHLHQVRSRAWTFALTLHVHEVDEDDLVL